MKSSRFNSIQILLASIILQLRFFKRHFRFLNLRNPQKFYDKVLWSSLYTDTSLWSKLADKYEVREYVKNHTKYEILNELYAVYDNPDDFTFEGLPDQFVVKTTNGCATNILIKDKNKANETEIKSRMKRWLRYPYAYVTGQLFYKEISPRIIVEKYLYQEKDPQAPLTDYKFYCFNGEPKYCNLLSNREFNTHRVDKMIYDLDWNPIPTAFKPGTPINEVPRPKSLNEMIEIARDLSQGIPYVRVDLYEINDKPLFGEMTFTPGFDLGYTEDFQMELGKYIDFK